jgi:hypothetical protein
MANVFTSHCLCLLWKTGSTSTNTSRTRSTEEYSCTTGQSKETGNFEDFFHGFNVVILVFKMMNIICYVVWASMAGQLRTPFLKRPSALSFVYPAGGGLLEGAAGQLQRGRHCYIILLIENAI